LNQTDLLRKKLLAKGLLMGVTPLTKQEEELIQRDLFKRLKK
jgi:hypothetical protein